MVYVESTHVFVAIVSVILLKYYYTKDWLCQDRQEPLLQKAGLGSKLEAQNVAKLMTIGHNHCLYMWREGKNLEMSCQKLGTTLIKDEGQQKIKVN